MRRAPIVCALLAGVAVAGLVAAGDPDAAVYRAAAARAESAAAGLGDRDDGRAGTEARRLRAEIGAALERDGASRNLARALTDAPGRAAPAETLRIVGRRLGRVAEALERGAAPPPDVERAHRLLGEILTDAAFAPEPEPGWLESAVLAVQRVLVRLLGRAARFASGHGGLLVAAAVLLALLAVGFVGVLVARALGRSARAPRGPVLHEGRAGGTESAAELLDRARGAVAEGRTAAALRLLDRAVVLTLRARGSLPPQPGLTDREAARWLAGRDASGLAARFDELAALHDRAVYGRAPIAAAAVGAAIAAWEPAVLASAGPEAA